MQQIEMFFTNKIKENGITKIIFRMKEEMEIAELKAELKQSMINEIKTLVYNEFPSEDEFMIEDDYEEECCEHTEIIATELENIIDKYQYQGIEIYGDIISSIRLVVDFIGENECGYYYFEMRYPEFYYL
jgi:hypothetical protein